MLKFRIRQVPPSCFSVINLCVSKMYFCFKNIGVFHITLLWYTLYSVYDIFQLQPHQWSHKDFVQILFFCPKNSEIVTPGEVVHQSGIMQSIYTWQKDFLSEKRQNHATKLKATQLLKLIYIYIILIPYGWYFFVFQIQCVRSLIYPMQTTSVQKMFNYEWSKEFDWYYKPNLFHIIMYPEVLKCF